MNHMVAAAILVASFALGSCTPHVGSEECKAQLLATLKSPSSLKIIKEASYVESLTPEKAKVEYILPGNLLEISKAEKLTFRRVTIEYDADNAYGAALRDTEYCTFVETPLGLRKVENNLAGDPKLTADNVMTVEEEADAALKDAEAAIEEARKADLELKALLEE